MILIVRLLFLKTQKLVSKDTEELNSSHAELKRQIEEEARVNLTVETFLKDNIKVLAVDLDKWYTVIVLYIINYNIYIYNIYDLKIVLICFLGLVK